MTERKTFRLSWPGMRSVVELCPSCQHKRFSPYLTSDGESADFGGLIFGRCSRVNSCGYHLKPWDVLDASRGPLKHSEPVPRVERKQARYLTRQFVRQFEGSNILLDYMERTFGLGSVKELRRRFDIGTIQRFGREHVIFWQTDENGNFHTGKAIPYEEREGQIKRLRGTGGGAYWMHKKLTPPPSELEWTSQFFGLKQLDTMRGANVGVVESEKTAVLCSLAFPEYAWVATGGSSFLTAYNNECTLFEPLRGKRCVLFPDSDQLDAWSAKGDYLRRQGFKVEVNTSWVEVLTPEQVKEGCDLGDVVLIR